MKPLILLASLLFAAFVIPAAGQELADSDYTAYSSTGEVLPWADVAEQLADYDVILVGETHNDSIGHIIELKILEAIAADSSRGEVAVSMEMFDRDVQFIVDEYLNGHISESHFVKSARAWDNYDTDYKPLVEFARKRGMRVVAANAPRRYVNKVSREGSAALASLPASARAFLPPLPVAPPTEEYKTKWNTLMAEAMQHMQPDTTSSEEEVPEAEADSSDSDAGYESHGGFNMGFMLEAQNVWDAGMAYSIAEHLTARPGATVVHYVGSFHVEANSGIPDQLRRYRPSARIGIVFMAPTDDPDSFEEEHRGTGDIVILTHQPSEDN